MGGSWVTLGSHGGWAHTPSFPALSAPAAGAGDSGPAPCQGRRAPGQNLALIPHTLGLPRVETPPCTLAKLLGEPERTLPRAEHAQGDHFQGLSYMLTWPLRSSFWPLIPCGPYKASSGP